jgi:hypothetical protein
LRLSIGWPPPMRDGEAVIGGVGVEVVLCWDLEREVRG